MPPLTPRSEAADAASAVPYWDIRRFVAREREALLAAVGKVLDSGQLILGEEVRRFESLFPAFCGVPFGVGVNSGTDAIFLALKALDIGTGDEVLTVANTAVPTVAAIRATGATPRFVDVEEETFLMDPRLVRGALTPRTKCVVPVHLAGQAVDLPALREAIGRRDIRIVEDCAQACGASCGGRRVGSLGDAGAFSFYPTKVLGAFGDAGMVVTSDESLHRRLRRLRFYGMEHEYDSHEEGYNSRLDEVQAALLNLQLPLLESAVSARQSLARQYGEALSGVGDIALPRAGPGRDHQYYLYTIRTASRDALRRHLLERGIETRVNYPVPVHLMRGYAFLGYHAGDLPATERLAATIVSLPMYPEMPTEHLSLVCDAVRGFFAAP